MLGVSGFIVSILGVVNFFSSPDKYTPFKEMVRKALLKYFARVNKQYAARGLTWDVRDNHFWLEIKINRSKADAYRRQSGYDPQAPDSFESEQPVGSQKGEDNDQPVMTNADGNLFTAAREEDNS